MSKGFKNKDIDLLVAYHRKTEPSKWDGILKLALIPLLLLLLVVASFTMIQLNIASVKSDTKDINAEIKKYQKHENSSEKSTYEEYLSVNETLKSLQTLSGNIASYPVFTSTIYSKVTALAISGVTLQDITYDGSQQLVALQVQSSLATNVESYVRALRALNIFDTVTYSGYQEQSESTSTSSSDSSSSSVSKKYYSFIVNCILKAGE